MTDKSVLYFPAIRTAFNEATSKLDNLMANAHQDGKQEVADAYRTAFELVRKGIQRAERQGESSLHKHLESELEEISAPIYVKLSETRDHIAEKWDECIAVFKSSVIALLKSKNVSAEFLESIDKDIDQYVHEHVEELWSNEGISP
mgnify:CR=1 FL=1